MIKTTRELKDISLTYRGFRCTFFPVHIIRICKIVKPIFVHVLPPDVEHSGLVKLRDFLSFFQKR